MAESGAIRQRTPVHEWARPVQPQDPTFPPQDPASGAAAWQDAEPLAALSRANLKLQEMNRHKDEFISRVSHELRTPIAAIHQFASILVDGLAGETTAEQNQYLGIILRNTKELHSMVAELIEATRAETGKLRLQPRRTSIEPVIEDVVVTAHALAAGRGIHLGKDVPRHLPCALADPQRVRQILVNLVDNAMKFTPENGRITIEARIWAEDDQYLRITVQDTGEGMSPEVLQRAFERLFQDERRCSSRQGLGLGLYICKQLVELQGGRIWAHSDVGHGSRFSFTVPRFSLANFVRATLLPGGQWVEAASIVRIQLVPRHRFMARRTLQSALHEYRTLLSEDAPGNLLVLPELSHDGDAIEILVGASCDESREHVERTCNDIAQRRGAPLQGFEPRIAARALPLVSSSPETELGRLQDIAARIEHGGDTSDAGSEARLGHRNCVETLTLSGKDPEIRVHQKGIEHGAQEHPHRRR